MTEDLNKPTIPSNIRDILRRAMKAVDKELATPEMVQEMENAAQKMNKPRPSDLKLIK